MSGRKDESAAAESGSTIFSIVAVIGAFCALMVYAYVGGQIKNFPAQIPSNNSTTAMIGEPSQ